MNLLKEHLRKSKSTEEGVRAYIEDVIARYSQLDQNTWGLRQQATCHWTVGFVTRADMATSLLMMPFWLIGHVTAHESKIEFVTFHYLTYSEARRLRRMRILKYFFLPFVILAIVMVGIALVISFVVVVVAIFHLDPDPKPITILPAALSSLGLGIFFLATLKIQQRL